MFGQMFSAPTCSWNSAWCISAGGLLRRAAQDQLPAAAVEPVREILERAQTGGVDRRHVPQSHDHDRRELVDVIGDTRDLVGRAEQERPVDAEDGDVVGNLLVLQDVDAAGFHVLRA